MGEVPASSHRALNLRESLKNPLVMAVVYFCLWSNQASAIQMSLMGIETFFAPPNPISGGWATGLGGELTIAQKSIGLSTGALWLPRKASYLRINASSTQLHVPFALVYNLDPRPISFHLGGFFETLTNEPFNYGYFGSVRTQIGSFFIENRYLFGIPNYQSKDLVVMIGFTFGSR